MNPADELRNLGSLLEKFAVQLDNSNVVDRGSLTQLHSQAHAMKLYADKRKKQKDIHWLFVIKPDSSIAFREAETCSGIKPDIFCTIEFSFGEVFKLLHMNTVIRLWSTRQDRAYRSTLDSQSMEKQLESQGWKRVMLRIHFDFLPKSERAAPVFHMQVGGRQNDDSDLCWFPLDVDVPRMLCLPVDFFSGCEIIMANFFPSMYFSISEEGHWCNSIKWCEERVTRDELIHHLKSTQGDETMYRRSMCDRRNT